MDAYESRILREFRAAIERDIEDKVLSIAAGVLGDHAAYKHQCGVVQGMRNALETVEEIEKKINGDH